LKHIRSLDLSHNKLHILPPSICDLVGLEDLDISGNDFAELPDPVVRLCRTPNAALSSLRVNRGVKIPADLLAKSMEIVEVDHAQKSL
jgi:Leucine-rich repeat (LRR) protein